MEKQLSVQLDKKKIALIVGGRFSMHTVRTLEYEGQLAGIAIASEDEDYKKVLEENCSSAELPFLSVEKGQLDKLSEWIETMNPDFVFSIAFPYKIPSALIDWKKDAFINFHLGPLPQYRGPMPIFEVLRYGESQTGISVHFMDKEYDEGDLILTESLRIQEGDTFGKIAVRLSRLCAATAKNLVEMLNFASIIPRRQQNPSDARYFEFPEACDTLVDWQRMGAKQIENLVNACNPWNVGAEAVLFNELVKLIVVRNSDQRTDMPAGTVLGTTEDELLIACDENSVLGVRFLRCEHGFISAMDFAILHSVHKVVYHV